MWIKISIAMLAFAVNSLLCRLALAEQQIDPMSFSLLRVGSGVVCLGLFYVVLQVQQPIQFQWKSALSLAVYLLGFSLAYLHIGRYRGINSIWRSANHDDQLCHFAW